MKTRINSPSDLLFDQLRDLHSMEVQIGTSLPCLESLITNNRLKELIANHASQNGRQIAEIAAIFAHHGKTPGEDKCQAMEGLIEGGTAHLEGVACPQSRDLMMIAHCLRIEYYEMAAYEFTSLLSRRLEMFLETETLCRLLREEQDMAAALLQLEPEIFENAKSMVRSCLRIYQGNEFTSRLQGNGGAGSVVVGKVQH